MATVLRPFLCTLGIPWDHTEVVARAMAIKVMLNEATAAEYLKSNVQDIGIRSGTVATLLMCGSTSLMSYGLAFAAFQLLAPLRVHELAGLIPRAMVTACAVAFINGCFASLLLDEEHGEDK